MTDTDAMTDFIRSEQVTLWHDLDEDVRSAINGIWSIAAGGRAQRIVAAARLVGPTPRGEVPWRLSASGIYDAILTVGGFTPDAPSEAEWAEWDILMSQYGGTRAALTLERRATVDAINVPREARWIADKDDEGDSS